ncbi:uncharacterized protein LOC113216230 [Frankliniella occidentalis]|uniref:Uncharacterized protein LOC113216230 n=1 Tax=Frankliniella occidentalis TaxID=133901 RepID=A0A6J1TLQ1_FRAOC|nr:uncharacterized protein LOC113216230 [Frankliniella occidentalis]
MYRSIVKLLAGEENVNSGLLSKSGRKKETVKFPTKIAVAALSYTSANSKGKDFDADRTLVNMLRRKTRNDEDDDNDQLQGHWNQVQAGANPGHVLLLNQVQQGPGANPGHVQQLNHIQPGHNPGPAPPAGASPAR